MGKKHGGRTKGTPNKATVERERAAAEIAKRTVADARHHGKKLAKEVLEDFMFLFAGMAAHHQPAPPTGPSNPNENRASFVEEAKLAVYCAKELAPYQSYRFAAVAVTAPDPEATRPVLDLDAAGNITNIDDPIRLGAVYRRLIKASRGG